MILVNKPLEWTSFDVVKKLRGSLKIRKIGHAGTLDPLATGLLVICTGKKTKDVSRIQDSVKEYTGTIMLGVTTESYDLETPVQEECDVSHITQDHIRQAMLKLTGMIEQVPPIHSAVKIGGKRAYKLARSGKKPELSARKVEIREFEMTGFRSPEVDFKVVCSKGTYIRSLAHDLGQLTGCGACLKSLTRTRVGEYSLDQAMTIEEVIAKYRTG